DVNMRDIDEGRLRMKERDAARSGEEDDFELGDGTGAAEYSVATEAEAPPDAGPVEETEPPEVAADSAPPAGEAATTAPPAEGKAPPEPAVAHSVETGGDVLLDAALAEQAEAAKRSKLGRRRLRRSAVTAATGDRFLVFCPNGHRIQVQERHRGRTGRCPNCKALFFVPVPETTQTLGQAGGQPATVGGASDLAAGAAPVPAGYSKWITDVRLHRVNPAKLKLVPGSLEADYEAVDLGTCPEHLLVAVVYAGSGPFRAMQEP